MRTRLSLVLLAAVLVSVLASSQALALCYAECPNGSYCTGIPVCCCVNDLWPYCGPVAGNPCFGSSAARSADQEAAVQSSYAAIFAPAPTAQPAPSK
ncbi:MAG: hypothetical protein ABUT39_08070 [Acidobacteriota bacterium]